MLPGVAELLLTGSDSVRINDRVEYVGLFYFETDGMQDKYIVHSECEMVRACTDAIFLLDAASCPGTICELTAASMLGKRVHIFYLRRKSDEETESSLHTPCWYPILHSAEVNANTRICECTDMAEATEKICATVRGW
ncbi:MAG: hypothetical protein IJW21_07245 [Clostridia bacterium]|nr:hypothetical protein [Clostridia bacterium]